MKSKKLFFASAMALTLSLAPICVLNQAETIHAEVTNSASITITNATDGDQFEIYQIFSGTYSKKGDEKTLADVDWATGVTNTQKEAIFNALGLTTFTTERPDTYPTIEAVTNALKGLDEAGAQDFAKSIASAFTGSANVITAVNGTAATSEKVADGYYLIKHKIQQENDTVTPGFILQVVGPTEVKAKSTEKPVSEKKVSEDDKDPSGATKVVVTTGESKKMNDVADYDIGEKVPFQIAAVVPGYLDNYRNYDLIFHDEMDSTLTLDTTSVKVYYKRGNSDPVEITGQNYVYKATDASQDSEKIMKGTDTFAVKVKVRENEQNNLQPGDKVFIEFKATLNNNALIYPSGNENSFKLEYTNKSETGYEETPKDTVVVFTYEIDVNKVDPENQGLQGAEFIIYKVKTDGTTVYFQADTTKTNADGSYTFGKWVPEKEKATTLTSDSNGKYKIMGIDDCSDGSTLYLSEEKAPDGYNKLQAPKVITLTAATNHDNGLDYSSKAYDSAFKDANPIKITNDKNEPISGQTVEVKNNKGSDLPETGGIGTTTLYITGAILAGGAAVLYVTNKRMKKEM